MTYTRTTADATIDVSAFKAYGVRSKQSSNGDINFRAPDSRELLDKQTAALSAVLKSWSGA